MKSLNLAAQLRNLGLIGVAFTALAAGAAFLLAESWFQKMRQRREHFKTWQDRATGLLL
jgi:hypothetical protein